MDVPIASLPIDLTPFDAVEDAYARELDELAALARRGETALIECDPELSPHLHRALRQRLEDASAGRRMSVRYVAGQEPDRVALGGRFELEVRPTSLVEALLGELRRWLQEGSPSRLLVIAHFELLATTADGGGAPEQARAGLAGAAELHLNDGGSSREAGDRLRRTHHTDSAPGLVGREVMALLADNPGVPVLALCTPDVLVPEPLARAFTRRGFVGPVSTEGLRHLVLRREGRKLGVESLDLESLACALDGLNALEVRRALAPLESRVDHDPRFPAARDALLAELAALPRPPREPRPLFATHERPGVEWRLRRRS